MYVAMRLKIGKNKTFIGKGVRELLDAIDAHHSIKSASKATGISYPKSLRMLKTLEEELGYPVVISQKGGYTHGKTTLTKKGRQMLESFREIESAVTKYAEKLVHEKFDF